ncbi:MAG: hypothetical protein FWD31_01125, partial [Planctomycetaceae bacterium]|nr:hypothetical protein [Planctomycetaceae bacterium]
PINKTTCVFRKHGTNQTNQRPYALVRRFADLYKNVCHYSGRQYGKMARDAVNRIIPRRTPANSR